MAQVRRTFRDIRDLPNGFYPQNQSSTAAKARTHKTRSRAQNECSGVDIREA